MLGTSLRKPQAKRESSNLNEAEEALQARLPDERGYTRDQNRVIATHSASAEYDRESHNSSLRSDWFVGRCPYAREDCRQTDFEGRIVMYLI